MAVWEKDIPLGTPANSMQKLTVFSRFPFTEAKQVYVPSKCRIKIDAAELFRRASI